MKYFAILRDSLREALDTKVFYVMVALSLLVVLVVASVSFKPLGVEDELNRFAEQMTWVISMRTKGGAPTHFSIEDFQQTNDAPASEPWLGNYRFNLVWHFPDRVDVLIKEPNFHENLASRLQNDMRFRLHYLNDVKVSPADSNDPTELRFLVTTRGSKITNLSAWPHEPRVFFAVPVRFLHLPLGDMVHFIEDTLVNTLGAALALLISTIVTAFFIPNMLRKGTVDLLLVKPIHRTTLLLYKYVGGLLFMFLNTALIIVGVWLVLGLRSGLWSNGFLLSILVITYQFAVYYAISTLCAVWTRSPIVAILVTCVAWFIFWVVGTGYRFVDMTRVAVDPEFNRSMGVSEDERPREKPLPEWTYTTVDTIHFVCPRMKDLDVLSTKLITDDLMPPESPSRIATDKLYASFKWGESLIITSLYVVVFLGIACWWFTTKDY
jgi:ABC-type transport system involved in multi-copper enzyme maturation permease subunit